MQIDLKRSLREYQKEALDYALGSETAVCILPTGTGKTLVGVAWAIELLNKGKAKRILVLEPSRFLVEQTYKVYLENTNLSGKNVTWVYGSLSKEEREKKEIWRKGIVVICTPQTAFNDLHLLEDFDAVVVDECHHTTGKYAYVELLSKYHFKYRLGLTATLSDKVRSDVIRYLSNNIKTWTWEELKKKYPQYKFPDWIGEIYDAELNEEEIGFLLEIEKADFEPSLRSFCLRTFTRDGALALTETLNNPETKLSKEFPKELKDKLTELRGLHKMEIAEAVLNEHDFEKAIIFTDRVCIADKIFKRFQNLNPVLFLGRLRMGLENQKEVLHEAQNPEHKLIISTRAGEEGIDLPTADLLIIWSNVASPIRFIQRHGRITRPSEKLKVVTFIATPGTPEIHSPDYDSLVEGLILAKENGLDIAGLEDEEFVRVLKTKSFRNRIKTLLDPHPLTFNEILENFGLKGKGKTKVKRWLLSLLKEEEEFRILYFYYFPYEEIKNKLDRGIEIYRKKSRNSIPGKQEGFHRFATNFFSKLTNENRFYFSFEQIEQIEFEKEFSQYFPSPKDLNIPLHLEYRIKDGKDGKRAKIIYHGALWFNGKKFKISEFNLSNLCKRGAIKITTRLVQINEDKYAMIGYSTSDLEILSCDLQVVEFEEIIERVYKITEDKYVQIIFSARGKPDFLPNLYFNSGLKKPLQGIEYRKPDFLPNLYFNGRFNKKALELIFRNAFYVALNIKRLLETCG